jgi:succinoglycan biosynthesis transport protein ExoP
MALSIAQILTIARAYWKQVVIVALGTTILTAVAIKFLPKTYTATATLIVSTENKDPLAGQQFPIDVLGNYVATQTELMLSPVVLLPVVDKLHLTSDKNYTAGFRGGDATALREYVEKDLSTGGVQVETGRGGQLLYVSGSARDPGQAADIANAVADVYLAQKRRRVNDPAGERAERYSEQLAELRVKTVTAQDKVTEFRRHNGLTDVVAANNDVEMQALTSLESRLLDAQNQRRSLEAKQAGQQSTANETLSSPQITALKTQVSTIEAQLAQQQPTLGPRHPAVMELNSRLAATRRSLAGEMETLHANNATEISRARDLEEKLTRAVADQRQKVVSLRQLQGEGAKLQLELESAQSVYKRALDGYDQIMFASVGNYTNVTFISRATPPLKASKPNKLKLLAVGVIFGLGLGLVMPFSYELFVNRRLRCRDDIEREFGIPVLAHFDAIPAAPGGA